MDGLDEPGESETFFPGILSTFGANKSLGGSLGGGGGGNFIIGGGTGAGEGEGEGTGRPTLYEE